VGAEEQALPAAPEPEERAPAGGSSDTLTRRQGEVALLVAQEFTNRQVAAELMLSERTVATHVHEILKKLGLQSSAELAAGTTEQEPLQ
jgi:non-specific serine/threonine protein kinase